MLVTLFPISVAIFVMVRLLPGNIIDVLFAGDAHGDARSRSTQALDAARHDRLLLRPVLALDRPDVLHGDFGRSLPQPAADLERSSATRCPINIELVLLGLLIALSSGSRSGSSPPSGATAPPTTPPASPASSGSRSRTSGSRRCS